MKIQNRRYEMLALISNEYMYEYQPKSNQLKVSEKCRYLFGAKDTFDKVTQLLKDHLSNHDLDENNPTIKLPLANGNTGVFKTTNTSIYDEKEKIVSIIGKLVDVTDKVAEKEALIMKSQIDGLTGLYNASTTREYIIKMLNEKESTVTNALLIIDCDDFKHINDTYGHLVGDKILEQLGSILKQTFINTDIIGRMGGDEFCVYIKDISSIAAIEEKCNTINPWLKEAITGVNATVSIGMALVEEKDTFEDVFNRADQALYKAKENGKAQFYY
ncbi:MAG: GGDEF domain-containing protein [Clostridiales bacterium]|nr:GGDEF domain-containing protein [Clostridiales bacterium]